MYIFNVLCLLIVDENLYPIYNDIMTLKKNPKTVMFFGKLKKIELCLSLNVIQIDEIICFHQS